jgi:hypothetical protein
MDARACSSLELALQPLVQHIVGLDRRFVQCRVNTRMNEARCVDSDKKLFAHSSET